MTSLNTIDLSFNKLTSLETNSFSNLTSLRTIYLRNNQISKISPNAFSGFSYLYMLDLSFNSLSTIDATSFTGLTGLTELILDSNSIKTINSTTFSAIKSLQTLSLRNNALTSIDGFVFKSMVTKLLLGFNQIGSINMESITGLDSLSHLEVNNNKITSLDTVDFDLCSNLYWVDVSGNPLKSYDVSIFEDSSLSVLIFSNLGLNTSGTIDLFNKIEFKLTHLDLSRNKIEELGTWLGHQNQLSILNLFSNKIRKIQHKTFHKLGFLTNLTLSSNQLSSLDSDSFRGLNSLKYLDLSGNKLMTISDYAFRGMHLSDWSFTLNISNNKLTSINKNTFSGIVYGGRYSGGFDDSFSIRVMSSYGKLDLSGNRLSTIDPNAFSEIGPHLKTLNLMNNSLSYLDTSTFLQLLNLKYLALSGNRVFDNQTSNNTLRSLCWSCEFGLENSDELTNWLDDIKVL